MDLSDDEKKKIDEDIDRVRPEDEREVRGKFEEKYREVAGLASKAGLKVVRDLLLNVQCLYEMLVDPDYTLPWETKAAIVFALGYFISPVDAIPDFIPVVGYMDDALVVAYVVHKLSADIGKYRAFRKDGGRPLPDV